MLLFVFEFEGALATLAFDLERSDCLFQKPSLWTGSEPGLAHRALVVQTSVDASLAEGVLAA